MDKSTRGAQATAPSPEPSAGAERRAYEPPRVRSGLAFEALLQTSGETPELFNPDCE